MPTQATVEINGAHIWTSQQGTPSSAPPLVLLHGGPGLWEDFASLAEMVDDLTEVYRYDQRGCGRSDRDGAYDLATAVADLDALRKRWVQPRLILGGHSFGAALALAYAVEHPEQVAALVLISGTGVDLEWREEAKAEAAPALTARSRAPRGVADPAGGRRLERGLRPRVLRAHLGN